MRSDLSGAPDTPRSGVEVARVSARSGRVIVSDPLESHGDRLLTAREVGALVGLKAGTWRSYVSKGYAPQPDDRDEGRPVTMRMPRWSVRTIAEWRRSRPGQGRRTDLAE